MTESETGSRLKNGLGLAFAGLYGLAAVALLVGAAATFGVGESPVGLAVAVLLFVPTGLLAFRAAWVFGRRLSGPVEDPTVPWWYAAVIAAATYPPFAILMLLAPGHAGIDPQSFWIFLTAAGAGFAAWPVATWYRQTTE